ncbi:Ferric reductase transmembrane component 6 [Ceratocystis lukuohia]|uniref:Ferric reductase transmembrane component 6 n=1 Tax=Ceratocystis lukuohia TaxID=2019550 RepID=A0ABR4MNJ6_9PEZI
MSAPAMQSLFRLLARHEGHHDDEGEEDGHLEAGETEHHDDHKHGPDRQWANRNHLLSHVFMATVVLVFAIRLSTALYQSWQRRQRTRAAVPLRQASSQHASEKLTTIARSILASATLVASTTLKLPSIRLPAIPLGQVIFLGLYSAFVAGLLSYRVVKHDETYAERIGFRGALISIPQVPVVYVLATRAQIPGLRYLLGGSYKDLIWFHRWVSRIFIGSVTVHAVAFFAQWAPAHFLSKELEIVPYVKWGIVAWVIMLWTVLSSLLPLRKLSYEFFVIQHTVCAFLCLWLMWLHVPGHHRRSVEMAVGLIVVDWVSRVVTAIYMNVSWKSQWGNCTGYNIGHKMTLEAVGKDMTVVTLHNAGNVSFQAGQSIDLWMPMFAFQSPHPFTILPPLKDARSCQCPRIQLALKTKTGFTAKLNNLARASQNIGNDGFRAFVLNKEGRSPPLDKHDTLVLVSSSTGASFSAAVAEKILAAPESHVRKIKLLMIGREKAVLHYYRTRIKAATEAAINQGVAVSLEVAITGRTYQNLDAEAMGSSDSLGSLLSSHDGDASEGEEGPAEEFKLKPSVMKGPPPSLHLKPMKPMKAHASPLLPLTPYTATSTVFSPGSSGFDANDEDIEARKASVDTARSSLDMDLDELGVSVAGTCEVIESYGRPSVSSFIRAAISSPCSGAVSVCGGEELVADVRTAVARINISRAKVGQEACYLHVEGFSAGS